MLFPLQSIKKKIQSEISIPQIAYYVKESQEIYEDEWDEINHGGDIGGDPKHLIETIKVSKLKQKPYLESESDVETFITQLKDKLMQAVRNKMKVKIE